MIVLKNFGKINIFEKRYRVSCRRWEWTMHFQEAERNYVVSMYTTQMRGGLNRLHTQTNLTSSSSGTQMSLTRAVNLKNNDK